MKKFLTVAAVFAAATLAATAPAAAESATGTVIVFTTELSPVTTYDDPQGCVKLPLDSHVLVNQTDNNVIVHADPFCLTPGLTVAPGYGSHVALGSGSFSVDR